MKKYLLIVLICTILIPLNLKAAEKTPTEQEMKERIAYIQQALDEGESAGKLWWGGFTVAYGTAAVGQLAAGFMPEDGAISLSLDKNKPSMIVGGTKALLGTLALLIEPLPAAFAPDKLREIPDDDLKSKLEKAESLLKSSADAEIKGKSWVNHALGIGINTVGALAIWFGYSNYIKDKDGNPVLDGLVSLVSGIAIGELQIWLQPARAIDDWNKYEQKYISGKTSGRLIRPDNSYHVFATPVVSTNMAGIIAGVSF